MTYLMNNFLSTRDKSFEKQLSYYLEIRKKDSNTKKKIVTKILMNIKKNGDTSLIKYEKFF